MEHGQKNTSGSFLPQKRWKEKNPEAVRRQQKKDNWKLSYDRRGRLTSTWAGIRTRCLGKGLPRTRHIYEGLVYCDRASFISWAIKDSAYHSLFASWEQSRYQRRLSPTIDRIDSSKGYELSNLQWLSRSENATKALQERYH